MLGLLASGMMHCSLASNLAQSWPGPSCSKLGSDNPGVRARFEFRFEILKSCSVLNLFVYKLMIGSTKNNTENYLRKCF